MPTITLTDPTPGTTVATGLMATNFANLRTLLNSGLDYVNLKGNPQLVAKEFPVWDGTQFVRSSSGLSYTAFTSSFGASGGGASLGNGTCSGRYIQIGKFVHFQGRLAFGSTTNVGTGYFLLSYPVGAAAATVSPLFGTAYLYDTSAGFITQALVANENNAQFRILFDSTFHGGATNASGGIPYTWATGDEINFNIIYESA